MPVMPTTLGSTASTQHRLTTHYRPGARMSDADFSWLIYEMRVLGEALGRSAPPGWTALCGSREALGDVVVSTARRPDGMLAGLCTAVLLQVPGLAPVLHLRATAIHPDDVGHGLGVRLVSRLVRDYVMRHRPVGRVWVSHTTRPDALGPLAARCNQVFPSPLYSEPPTARHRLIAETLSEHYRDKIAIADASTFDAERFAFVQADGAANDDAAAPEVIQVGHLSALTLAGSVLPGARARRIRRVLTGNHRQRRLMHDDAA